MRFPLYFKRQVGAASSDPLLGSDAAPVVADGKRGGTNVFEHKAIGANRIVAGYWYEGGGAAPDLPVSIWVMDDTSGKYYMAANGTLKSGQLLMLKCPRVPPPPQTTANLGLPDQGAHVLVIVSDNSGPTGIYHFAVGPDLAIF